MKTVPLPIKKIKPNPNNPRTIDEESLKKLTKSIKDFPEMLQVLPIVIDKNFVILGGNMRYQAAVNAGLTTIPVIQVTNWTEKKKNEFIIKDNVSGGEWDLETLINDWDSKDLEDWGFDMSSFGPETETTSFEVKKNWNLIVECKSKKEMQATLEKLTKQGLTVKTKSKK